MKWTYFFLMLMGLNAQTFAEPVWHCSRNSSTTGQTSSLETQANQFSIASLNPVEDVISLSLNDLIDIYSGVPVRIGGISLSACFMVGNEKLTSPALASLGLQPSAIQALARKSAIVQSNLYPVTTDTQMLTCIANHFPTVGYLEKVTITDDVQPCF